MDRRTRHKTRRYDSTAAPAVEVADTGAESAWTLPLTRAYGPSGGRKYFRATVLNETKVFSDSVEASYNAAITFGNQTFTALVDTGSADTWVVRNNFSCVDFETSEDAPQSACKFGPTYRTSSTFKALPNVNFQALYGDGQLVAGVMGKEKVTLANLTVQQQEIALIENAYYEGDGVSSGLIGLAYPNLTQSYYGTPPPPGGGSYRDRIQYTPIFTNMYRQNGIPPLFSMALSRDNDTGGVLAFGGLPQGVPYSGTFVNAPIRLMRITELGTNTPIVSYIYTFYAIDVQRISLDRSARVSSVSKLASTARSSTRSQSASARATTFSVQVPVPSTIMASLPSATKVSTPSAVKASVPVVSVPEPSAPAAAWWRAARAKRQTPQAQDQPKIVMIVDSGTTLLYVPDQLATQINAAFDPPAEYDRNTQSYFVACDAKAPSISIRINGTDFNINPQDLIVHNVTPRDNAPADIAVPCGSGVAPAGSEGLFVLGDVFLKNVLAVFDVGAGQMRFAQR